MYYTLSLGPQDPSSIFRWHANFMNGWQKDAVLGTSGSAGPSNPSAGADDAGAGNIAWLNPGNVTASDNSRATSSIFAASPTTHILKATNYGFSVPANATIDGVELSVERQQSTATDVHDQTLKLLVGGTQVGSNKAAVGSWPTTEASATYGGPTDLWGTTLTPSDVNGSTFGAALQAALTTSNSVAKVDNVRITVYYTTAGSAAFTDADANTNFSLPYVSHFGLDSLINTCLNFDDVAGRSDDPYDAGCGDLASNPTGESFAP